MRALRPILALGAALALAAVSTVASASVPAPNTPAESRRIRLGPPRRFEALQVPQRDTVPPRVRGLRSVMRPVAANVYPRRPDPVRAPAPAPPPDLSSLLGPQRTVAFEHQVALGLSFRANVQGSTPADCHIAAGPAHVVTVTNSRIQVYSRTGDSLFAATLDAFVGLPAGYAINFDPKIVFDEGAGRFYLVTLANHPTLSQSTFQLAISTGSDPLGAWHVYSVRNDRDGLGIDYEELGFGPRGIYLSGNYFQFPGWGPPSMGHTTTLWAMSKAELLAGGNVSVHVLDDLQGFDSPLLTTKVAQAHGTPPAGLDGFLVGFDALNSNASRMRLTVHGIALPPDFPASAPVLSLQSVETDTPPSVPNAPQAGGPALVQTDNLGAPPLVAVYRDGHLFTTTHFTGASGMDARLFDVSVGGWPALGLAVQTVSSSPMTSYWPSTTVNAYGDVVLGFSRSSSTTFAGAGWALRLEDETGFGPASSLVSGEAYYGGAGDTPTTVHRWGDYSGTAVDPVSQGFWIFNMYASSDASGPIWRSRVGFVPRTVFVDVLHAGVETGSRSRPWNTVGEGVADARNENHLVVRAGTYTGVTLLTKPMLVIADGGTVQLQP